MSVSSQHVPPTYKASGGSVPIYHQGGGGAIGLYAAVLQNAEGVLNETYSVLLENRSFIEDMLARKYRRSTRDGPDRQRIYRLYVVLLRWWEARCWFAVNDHGAVTMRQVFDIAAVDPAVKQEQLAARLELPWPPQDVLEVMGYYYARVRNKINAQKRM